MRRECRERFPRHWLQRKPLVNGPSLHHGTCVTHVPWCMSGSLTRGDGDNVPDIPDACATRNFTYLVRGPWYTNVNDLISPDVIYDTYKIRLPCPSYTYEQLIDTLRLRQDGQHFHDDILKCIFWKKISLFSFIFHWSVFLMVWLMSLDCFRYFGAKPLFEPMMT